MVLSGSDKNVIIKAHAHCNIKCMLKGGGLFGKGASPVNSSQKPFSTGLELPINGRWKILTVNY